MTHAKCIEEQKERLQAIYARNFFLYSDAERNRVKRKIDALNDKIEHFNAVYKLINNYVFLFN